MNRYSTNDYVTICLNYRFLFAEVAYYLYARLILVFLISGECAYTIRQRLELFNCE